ncbi:MAG: DUF3783 domain-containing protein [Finegoldia sp.]|nr:DUF3783 domain-containing protein [Finegoldia sp.]
MKKALIYNMPQSLRDFLTSIALDHDFEIIEVDNSYLSTRVEDILSKKDPVENSEEEVDINFLLLDGFDNEALSALLETMKENRIYIPNKCVSTPNNLGWPLKKLLLENKEENEIMSAYRNLSILQRQAIGYLKENENSALEEAVIDVDAYIKKRDLKTAELIELADRLRCLLK